MSGITNQPSFTPLVPLPAPIEQQSYFALLAKRVALVVVVSLFGGGVGLVTGMLFFKATQWHFAGLALGTLVGAVGGCIVAYLMPTPDPKVVYRLETLRQMKGGVTNQKALDALNALEISFSYPFGSLSQNHHLHLLHTLINRVTKAIDSGRADVKQVWESFLKHLQGREVTLPDGFVTKLDFDLETEILKGKKVETDLSLLDLKGDTIEGDLHQIEEIQRVSFGKVGTLSAAMLKQQLSQLGSRCVVIREQNKPTIFGFAWSFRQQSDKGIVNIIAGVAKDPRICSGLGDQLLYGILVDLAEGEEAMLHVRKSNRNAIDLYARWGFVESKILPKYYQDPEEDAIEMPLDWSRYGQVRKAIAARQQQQAG